MKTILLCLMLLMNISALECTAQSSKLPKKMPAETEIDFHEDGGMINAFTRISIKDQTIAVEEKKDDDQVPRQWTAKIEKSEQENLYKIFVDNKFDTLKNDEREGIVYDAGSESVSLSLGSGGYNISYGANSPLSGVHKKRYQTIASAIHDLRQRYENRARKSADSNFAVLELNSERFEQFFKNAKPATLSVDEITAVNNILKRSVDDYNSDKKTEPQIIKLDKYKFQFIGLLNKKAEKEVWVNSFCSEHDYDWRNQILFVKDGGNCFFNLYINLTKESYDRFSVNGDA